MKYVLLVCVGICLSFVSVSAAAPTFYNDVMSADNPKEVLNNRLHLDEATGFYYVYEYDGLSIVGWDLRPFEGSLVIPEMIDNRPVTAISHYAFTFKPVDGYFEHYLHQMLGTPLSEQQVGFDTLLAVESIVLPDSLGFVYESAFAIDLSLNQTIDIPVENITFPEDGLAVAADGMIGLVIEGEVSASHISGRTGSSFHPDVVFLDDNDAQEVNGEVLADVQDKEDDEPSVAGETPSKSTSSFIVYGAISFVFAIGGLWLYKKKTQRGRQVPTPVRKATPSKKPKRSTRR